MSETGRHPEYPIQKSLLNRWSPRALSGQPISDEILMSLFEAARWAPSSYNAQPWRFIYAKRETPDWGPIFDLMIDFNKSWTDKAAALVVVISRKTFEHNGKPSVTHSYDTGAAWENLALEGSARGLVIHGMQGFDYEKARLTLQIPDDYQVEAMIAIGYPGHKEDLSTELKEKEVPSSRRPLQEIVMKGKFRK